MTRRYKPPPIKATKPIVTGHRLVWTSGVPGGTVHRQPLYGEQPAERTVCGNWPGRQVVISADSADISECPACFRQRAR